MISQELFEGCNGKPSLMVHYNGIRSLITELYKQRYRTLLYNKVGRLSHNYIIVSVYVRSGAAEFCECGCYQGGDQGIGVFPTAMATSYSLALAY